MSKTKTSDTIIHLIIGFCLGGIFVLLLFAARVSRLETQTTLPPVPTVPVKKELFCVYPEDKLLTEKIIAVESSGNPKALSPVGARGLMQLMPATAKALSRKLLKRDIDMNELDNPLISMTLGQAYVLEMYTHFNHNLHKTLTAYNAGPGNVHRGYTNSYSKKVISR